MTEKADTAPNTTKCDGPHCKCSCHIEATLPGPPSTRDWCSKCDRPPPVIEYSGHPADDN